ncbi:MAG: hypothetical protein EOO43_11110 [Flavobacterium sp.]|nr:MAG: hypothetical protein EOO43_11110 [Flavobacterium sp.]
MISDVFTRLLFGGDIANRYDPKIKIDGKRLIYHRSLQIIDGTFPAENYSQFSKFMSDVNVADHIKLVLSLKE